jgi:hypothetical protein
VIDTPRDPAYISEAIRYGDGGRPPSEIVRSEPACMPRVVAFLAKLSGPGMRDTFEQHWNELADEAAALLVEIQD